jgi:hypothetical protein
MVMAYNTNAGAGLASGVEKLASAFLQKRRNEGLASGLEQIQGGDWEGGINTIAETDPNTALGLVQYKQKQDDAMNMAQMKIAADIQNRNTLTPYQQEMLALKRQQLAQSGSDNPFNSKNEFINLMGIRNNPQVWDSLPDDQKALVNSRLSYMSNAPENLYDISYQKKAGSLQAQREGEQAQALETSENQAGNIDKLISDISQNKDLLGVYSAPRAGLARLTMGQAGYTPEQMEKRGSLIRQLGEVQNSIIQKARAAGQVGINTISEIRQATKGIDENTSPEEIIGALQYMKEKEQDLINRMSSQQRTQPVRTQQNIDYSNASDDDILQGLR